MHCRRLRRSTCPIFLFCALAACGSQAGDNGATDGSGGGASPLSSDAGPRTADGGSASFDDAGTPGDATVGGAGEAGIDAAEPVGDGGCGQRLDGGYSWPNSCSSANSDPWISAHHDEIVEEHPVALLIDFVNAFTTYTGVNAAAGYDINAVVQPLIQKHVDAFRVASMYHGYNDGSVPAFKTYSVIKIVDARDGNGKNNSSLIPLHTIGGSVSVDYSQFTTQAWTDRIGIQDPANPGNNLSVCQLFEKGIINEVWGMVADPVASGSAKFDETAESKQAYDANNQPISGRLVAVSNGQDITSAVPCKVSTRFYDFNPTRGPGCHLHANGHAWENYISRGALPAFANVARTFFNFDFKTRFNASFNSFYDVCPYTSAVCISWQSPFPSTAAVAGASSMKSGWSFSPLTAGCGNVHFPPNATTQYTCLDPGYDIPQTPSSAPTQYETMSSCEHYGLHDGPGGADETTPYSNAIAAQKYKHALGADANMVATDCGGPQPTYIFASMPGLGTTATTSSGTPMRNWWVYEYY
jgi:hypothetical protein